MGEPLGRIKVRVRRERPGLRRATYLETGEEVLFGVPGFQADHYKFPPDAPARQHAGTTDALTAGVAACLVSTLSGALAARGVPVDGDRLVAEADGIVEAEDKLMLLKAIEVRYRLVADPAREAEIMRAHDNHINHCSMARSVMAAIDISTSIELVPEAEAVAAG